MSSLDFSSNFSIVKDLDRISLACDGTQLIVLSPDGIVTMSTGLDGLAVGGVIHQTIFSPPRTGTPWIGFVGGHLLMRFSDYSPGIFTELDPSTLLEVRVWILHGDLVNDVSCNPRSLASNVNQLAYVTTTQNSGSIFLGPISIAVF